MAGSARLKGDRAMIFGKKSLLGICVLTIFGSVATAEGQNDRLLWGDTHLHTRHSFDAFLNSNKTAGPNEAYRWAKGLPVPHPYHGSKVQNDRPLDFLVIADHAELLGVIGGVYHETAELENIGLFASVKRWLAIKKIKNNIDAGMDGLEFFAGLQARPAADPSADPVLDPGNQRRQASNLFGDTHKISADTWHDIVDAAERHNEPGKFTSLIGWEWTSAPTGSNLHRVVFTPDGGDKAKQFYPFSAKDSQYPEDLWQWLDETREKTGTRFVAIPHNSNLSKGYMFSETTLKGNPINADYARMRVEWEPVVEVTQTKGDSETHPTLSPEDEFADFETYTHYIQQGKEEYKAGSGDYIRSALKQGLALEQKLGVNPFKFGLVGSTDQHNSLHSVEEDDFAGKFPLDSVLQHKNPEGFSIGDMKVNGWSVSASGLAAVWARDNTREEIFAAFQRKEVYATTGPRIQVRVFGGWHFSDEDKEAEDLATVGHARGVPMGGDLILPAEGGVPQLLIRATRDPQGASLDRVQVLKGWVDAEGQQHEQVYNAAWSGDRQLDASGYLPAVKNTVDFDTATYENSFGSGELSALWVDPDFDPAQRAFYYVRVLEIPTPRHSLYDAVAMQREPDTEEMPATIQERAYTSPIWFTP